MDIYLKTNVEGIGVFLSLKDCLAFIKDAHPLQRDVRAFLEHAGVDPHTGQMRPMALDQLIGRPAPTPMLRPGSGAEAIEKDRQDGKMLGRVSCPDCGESFAHQGTLGIHRKYRHPPSGKPSAPAPASPRPSVTVTGRSRRPPRALLKCRFCDREAVGEGPLARHMAFSHPKEYASFKAAEGELTQ